jgi:hypothetical protein
LQRFGVFIPAKVSRCGGYRNVGAVMMQQFGMSRLNLVSQEFQQEEAERTERAFSVFSVSSC